MRKIAIFSIIMMANFCWATSIQIDPAGATFENGASGGFTTIPSGTVITSLEVEFTGDFATLTNTTGSGGGGLAGFETVITQGSGEGLIWRVNGQTLTNLADDGNLIVRFNQVGTTNGVFQVFESGPVNIENSITIDGIDLTGRDANDINDLLQAIVDDSNVLVAQLQIDSDQIFGNFATDRLVNLGSATVLGISAAVPEPSTYIAMLLGFSLLIGYRRKK
ncbi:PEP-CTERM sorting domain-containing protein [Candidatus Uabimicrobium amorphum]|uniref:Uncharacterized protein n=1 Tax=Uabimicrobium amorphum TaxID=2596890 RepID=A0A5S9IP93_UABAM|nr:PEP-CTERM sorting domain-containing protein [Candidatus Uabimicrobium amorphum]BBM85167.1 hypothetical protein UABAM_03530 [Candidatus Uabimicrobium amorphum]